MNIKKIAAVVAVVAACASASTVPDNTYTGFNLSLGFQFWSLDGNKFADQSFPSIGFGFDIGMPLKSDSTKSMAIGFGGNGWIQSIELRGGKDDTGCLGLLGPSLNMKNGKFVGGFRLGTSFVVDTEYGEGGTLGFGINSYAGYDLGNHWAVIFDAHYTVTEYTDRDIDYEVGGIGVGLSYNGF